MIENINWYPGHMKKTRELIQENLKMVDLSIEVIDGRIPVSSRNPIIDDLVKSKKRIIILRMLTYFLISDSLTLFRPRVRVPS